MDEIALEPEAIARAMAFAIEQPDDVDVGDIVVRPTVQAERPWMQGMKGIDESFT